MEDRIFHAANMLDPLMLLGSAAACTRRIQLGTAVLVLTLRHAAVLARQASTLHHLSGGRLTLGVSLGGRPEEYAGLGVPMERRVAVFRESVTVLRRRRSRPGARHAARIPSRLLRPALRRRSVRDLRPAARGRRATLRARERRHHRAHAGCPDAGPASPPAPRLRGRAAGAGRVASMTRRRPSWATAGVRAGRGGYLPARSERRRR